MSLDSLIERDKAIIRDIKLQTMDYMQRTYGLSQDTVYELREIYAQRELRTKGEYQK